MSPSAEPAGRTLHDRIFKEFLYRFLPDFLHLFFPDKAAQLNFTTLRFLDKELVVNLPGQSLRITDVVAEVETVAGRDEVILVHVEVEASRKDTLPWRMFEYYALLRILRRKPVLPVALVLLPHAGGLVWQNYQEALFGQELVRFTYGQVGLRELSGETYLAAGNPVGAALAALMQPIQDDPLVTKLVALQNVLGSDLTEGEKLFLMGIIETYLPKEMLLARGGKTMAALEEIELMWHEKIARQGRLEGQRELLLRQLQVKFGPLPPAVVARIQAITAEAALEKLGEQVLTAESLADITLLEDSEG